VRTSFPPFTGPTCSDFDPAPGECVHAYGDRIFAILADLEDLELAPAHEVSQDARDHGVEALRARVTVVARPR